MFTKINIDNYRGLRDLALEDLGRINLFLGNSGSGKTSVLEVLYFLCGQKMRFTHSAGEVARQRSKLMYIRENATKIIPSEFLASGLLRGPMAEVRIGLDSTEGPLASQEDPVCPVVFYSDTSPVNMITFGDAFRVFLEQPEAIDKVIGFINTAIDPDEPTDEELEQALEMITDAEQAEMREHARSYYSAVENVIEELLGHHNIQVTFDKTTREATLTSSDWNESAELIIDTINGVGQFEFEDVDEFVYATSSESPMEAVVSHLHWVAEWPSVYGYPSPRQMLDKALE